MARVNLLNAKTPEDLAVEERPSLGSSNFVGDIKKKYYGGVDKRTAKAVFAEKS
jgi:hypothetical protein